MLMIPRIKQFRKFSEASQHGFTLVEMAVVLLIVGMLLNGLFVALGNSAESSNRSEASSKLQQIEEALYGFAQANGRLPCPATANAPAALLGQENPAGGGDCAAGFGSAAHGFVPAVTLGIQGPVDNLGLLLDPWGRPYRYSVSNLGTAAARVFTNTVALRARFLAAPPPSTSPLLCVAEAASCVTPLTRSAPAVVFSVGARPTVASTLEAENAGVTVNLFPMPNDIDFVSAEYTDADGTVPYDDIVSWLSYNILVTRMISAGQLP